MYFDIMSTKKRGLALQQIWLRFFCQQRDLDFKYSHFVCVWWGRETRASVTPYYKWPKTPWRGEPLAEMWIIDLHRNSSLNGQHIQTPVWAGCVWFLKIHGVCAFLWLKAAILSSCYLKKKYHQFNISRSQPFWTGCLDFFFFLMECPLLPYYDEKHNWEQIFHKIRHTPTM